MEVRTLLGQKARPVHTITGNHTVEDAINLMTVNRVSALIITENDQPIGIFAERDVFRSYLRDRTAAFSRIKLKNAMTDKLIVAHPADGISSVTAMMMNADIRHIPVIEEKKIIGILTLNDLIGHQIDTLTEEIHHLRAYIHDLHEAGQD